MNILISSNAPWSTSGYGNQTAMLAPRLCRSGHRVAISCFYGLEGGCLTWSSPQFPEHEMLCYPTDWSRFGAVILGEYAAHHGGGDRENTLVLTLQDLWPLLPGLPNMKSLRFLAWTPVDHDPCPPKVAEFIRETDTRVVAMTHFGEQALQREGFETLYAPHGVDTGIFKPASPSDRQQIRAGLMLPQDAFVVGMVACNQGLPSRKSFPQVFQAFKRFHDRHKDAILYVHADVLGRNNGVNLIELGNQCGIPTEVMRTSDQLSLHLGIPAQTVAGVFNAFDVLCMPSMGEGFGIPLIEAQACGVPVITSDFTAMSELCGAGWKVQGEKWWDGTQSSWQIVPYVGEIVEALELAYDQAAGLALPAVEFASAYDVEKVYEENWLPILAEVEKPREIPALRKAA